MTGKSDSYDMQVAVIGMAGRFPGARDPDELWRNVCDGVESISTFTDQELIAAGVPPEVVARPNYVKAKGMLEGIEEFDASFFGYNPQEAQLIDPQQRIFLECAYAALESAGYDSLTFPGRIAVFAGMGFNTYVIQNIWPNRHRLAVPQGVIHGGNDKDYIATRVAYGLDLRGPAVSIQTACSSGLVAAHMAAQSLLNGECDIAIVGGCTVNVPNKNGYHHYEGGILAPDGHCRPFDAGARGTVNGNACAIVVLKRMEDAVQERDTIHGVILSSAINNDGARKIGYTAPSVEGQSKVIAEALAIAGVPPETIGYIEAHGTGTELGDPIEVEALTQAFRASTEARQFCAIGSLKANIGHTDTASGVAGLIKAIYAVKTGVLPPAVHFTAPNPNIDFASSPFYVNKERSAWRTTGAPRRAGVSSFGVGGTNAHVIVQEPPPAPAEPANSRPRLLTISARTATALDAAAGNLAAHLAAHPELDLADVAYTLSKGRRSLPVRRVLVARDPADAADALAASDPRRVLTQEVTQGRTVAFMFPGQGAQHVGMAAELYREDEVFRAEVDRCAEILRPMIDVDVRRVINGQSSEAAELELQRTALAQPALFVVEYALASLWMSMGLEPVALIGHSVGELVAACLSSVFSLEDALTAVAARGRLMQSMPPGAMLAVGLPADDLVSTIDSRLTVAAINGPSNTVLSGPTPVIELLAQRLSDQGIWCRRLNTSHAFHSDMMEPVLEPFTRALEQLKLQAPRIPFISNLTGTWITPAEAVAPRYWANQLRQTVQFSNGLHNLTQGHRRALLEVGPGRVLSNLARQRLSRDALTIPSLRQQDESVGDVEHLLGSAGRLWLAGAKIDWEKFWAREQRSRVPLPSYPFERRRYWLDPPSQTAPELEAVAPELEAAPPEEAPLPLHARPSLTSPHVAAESEVEKRLVAIWQDCLAIEDPGIHDNFFELGGNSLMATQIVARLRDSFPVEIAIDSLISDHQTIAGLAAHIEELLIAKLESMSDEEAEDLL